MCDAYLLDAHLDIGLAVQPAQARLDARAAILAARGIVAE